MEEGESNETPNNSNNNEGEGYDADNNIVPAQAKAKENMKKLVEQCEYIPKSENFLNVLITKKDSEVPNLQKYLKIIRQETMERLIYILFEDEKTKMNFKY